MEAENVAFGKLYQGHKDKQRDKERHDNNPTEDSRSVMRRGFSRPSKQQTVPLKQSPPPRPGPSHPRYDEGGQSGFDDVAWRVQEASRSRYRTAMPKRLNPVS
ncbi:hypothetical protein KM043_006542 [Ampulex compressa]|nr:hypothetical protein KM043_006542 [Ampulex compressa]